MNAPLVAVPRPGLGEAGPHDDASYSGNTGVTSIPMDYARTKIREYQAALAGADAGYQALLLAQSAGGMSDDDADAVQALIDEFQSKRWTMKATAEAINAGAAVVNYAGGRMPQLSIPGTLGLVPTIPFAMVAAIGTAAAVTLWVNTWLKGANERLKIAQLLDAGATPEAKAQIAQAVIQADAAVQIADAQSGFGTLAPILKWGAIAVGAWMVWKAIEGMRKSRDHAD